MRPKIAGRAGYSRGLSVQIVSARSLFLNSAVFASPLRLLRRCCTQEPGATDDGLRDMNLFERNFAGRFRPPDPSIVDRPHGDWKPLLVRNPILEKLSG